MFTMHDARGEHHVYNARCMRGASCLQCTMHEGSIMFTMHDARGEHHVYNARCTRGASCLQCTMHEGSIFLRVLLIMSIT